MLKNHTQVCILDTPRGTELSGTQTSCTGAVTRVCHEWLDTSRALQLLTLVDSRQLFLSHALKIHGATLWPRVARYLKLSRLALMALG